VTQPGDFREVSKVKIPESTVSVQSLIDKHHESIKQDLRPHLGASILGHSCDRWLWLSFRWAVQPKFPGRILRLFRRGSMEEATIISDLRAIGMDVRANPSEQEHISFGGHIGGSVDGVIESGVPEAPKKRHIVEFKTHALKSFNDVEKNGVEKSKPMHFVQMQLYMHGMSIDRALYVAVCKDDDRIYTERVKYNKALAEKYLARGKRITTAERMPEPISSDPSWYECRFCDAHSFCHKKSLTQHANCRTCALSTPMEDGSWHCAKWDSAIPTQAQPKGCLSHVLHPDLVPWKLKDSPDEFTAVYEIDGVNVANGDPEQEGVWGSFELIVNASACASSDPVMMEIRKQFNARVTE
jgi:hypothetical protein